MKKLPLRYRIIQGAIGKRFVIKHYAGGRVFMTKYPNMKDIIPSEEQKIRRRLFKRATRYAQKVYANPALKAEKRKLLRRPWHLFRALVKEWFSIRKEKDYWRQRRLNKWQKAYHLNKASDLIIPPALVGDSLLLEPQSTLKHIRLLL